MVGRRLEVLRRLGEDPRDNVNEYIIEILMWVLFWVLLFYILAWTSPRWMKSYPPSSKDHENNRYWIARNVLGILHAILVCVLVVPAACRLLFTPPDLQYMFSTHIVNCEMGVFFPDSVAFYCIALAGLAFTTFTLSDVIVSIVHLKSIAPDAALFVHHAAFVAAGLTIRSHCMLPLNAALLMAMEVSTPFLNYLFLVRHRGDGYTMSTMVSGCGFFITYIIFRLILNTYGTILLWTHVAPVLLGQGGDGHHIIPETVPSWQVWFLLAAVTAGSAVQFFWFPGIWSLFMKNYRAAFGSDKIVTQNGGYEEIGKANA